MERQQVLTARAGVLRRWLGCAALVCLSGLALAGPAHAATYSPGAAFYWTLPADYGVYHPSAIAVSPDGNLVYVADGMLRHVIEYTSDGVLVRTWPWKKTLGTPTSITTDGAGAVYVLYGQTEMIVRYSADGKTVLGSKKVPFARAIAASGAGRVYVLTNFLNAVGVFNVKGKSIGGFVANLPGQFFPKTGLAPDPGIVPETGYDPPYKTVATEIGVDRSGNPIVVGESRQARNDEEPDCSYAIDRDGIDNHPYPDPLVSGEAARFSPTGTHTGYGWLTESPWDCLSGFGWRSGATNPTGMAVDPNSGDVFATSDSDLGVIHLRSDLENTDHNVNAYGPPCYSYTCSGPVRDWELIAGNPPNGVAVDCHSNLYMLSAGYGDSRYVTKFLDTEHPLPSSCPSRFAAAPPTMHVFKLGVGKLGPMKVLAGCSGSLCSGSLVVRSSSSLCPNCTLSVPGHFRIGAGLQRTLTLRLNGAGRRLLRTHPGLPSKVLGRLRGGQRFSQTEALRGPAILMAKCSVPGIFGGPATVSGTLSPSHAGERIRVEYLPPQSGGALLPAVQHTALTNHAGHFTDRLTLHTAGRWMVFATWAGDRTREPAAALPCAGTVAKIPTHVALTCPTGSSAGSPAQFSGTLSEADVPLAVVYEAPSRTTIGHVVSSGRAGSFTDAFSPSEPGAWQALAHYKGDSNHAGAEAVCRFRVAPDDFSVSVTPSSGSVAPGGSVNATLNTVVTSGASQTVFLGASGAPGPVTFSPTTITTGGSSNVTIAAPANAAPGSHTISLSAAGPWATHSTTYTLTVRKPSSLTLQCTPDLNRHFISCTGQLTSGGAGINGAQITLTYTPPSGPSTVHTTTTLGDGSFTDRLTAPAGSLIATGDWQVQAQFAGDGTHAATSTSQTVTVS
jgi:hypothetical protein